MNINYQLTNADFLEYQLYASSKSILHKKARFRSRIIAPIMYIIFAIYSFVKNGVNNTAFVFLAIALVWFVFYPLFSKWRYKRHFKKHVEENYKNKVNIPTEVTFNENAIYLIDTASNNIVNADQLREIIETKHHFFVQLVTGSSFIVPKHAIEDKTEFKTHITTLGAEYIDELNWEWK